MGASTSLAGWKLCRIYSTKDGESHFEDVTVEMSPAVYAPNIPLVDVADPSPASRLQFSRLPAGYSSDPHPAPRRQYVIVLSGAMKLRVSDGEERVFARGEVFLVEDTTGSGHKTWAVPPEPCVFLTVARPDDPA